MSFRVQNEVWRGENRRKTFPQELWSSDLEALEVSGTPKGNHEGLEGVCKSPQITIYGVCRVSMSRQGPACSPQSAPKELLESQNHIQSSPGELHRGFEELRKQC